MVESQEEGKQSKKIQYPTAYNEFNENDRKMIRNCKCERMKVLFYCVNKGCKNKNNYYCEACKSDHSHSLSKIMTTKKKLEKSWGDLKEKFINIA